MGLERSSLFNIRTVLGALIIIVGSFLLLEQFGYYTGIDFWDFWPLLLIIFGISRLTQPKEYRNLFLGGIILVIGVLFQLSTLDIIDFGLRQLWPIVLILVGIGIIRQAFWPGVKSDGVEGNTVNFTAMLGGGEYNYVSQSLVGGTSTTIMGGGTINLSKAEMAGDSIVLDIFALMGGVDIIIPKHWRVVFKGLPIMGGMSDKTMAAAKTASSDTDTEGTPKQLIIKGVTIMGGVEVKN